MKNNIQMDTNELILIRWLIDEACSITEYQRYPFDIHALRCLPFDFATHMEILESLKSKSLVHISVVEGVHFFKVSSQAVELSSPFDIFSPDTSFGVKDVKCAQSVPA